MDVPENPEHLSTLVADIIKIVAAHAKSYEYLGRILKSGLYNPNITSARIFFLSGSGTH